MFIKIIIAAIGIVILMFLLVWLETYVISKDIQKKVMYDVQRKIDDIWKFTFGVAAEPTLEEQQQMRQACRRILSHRVDDIQYKKQESQEEDEQM